MDSIQNQQPPAVANEQEEIRFLLLSDLHLPTENVQLLKQWHQSKNKGLNYNYVLVSGDILRLNNSESFQETSQTESEAEGMIQNLFMNELEGFADDLLYIPGNHDPSTLFAEDRSKLPILGSNPNGNIHRGIYKLRDNLIVIGLGGCVKDFVQENGEGPMKPCWLANIYPYYELDHKTFNEHLDQLWMAVQAQYPDPDVQVIVLTHEGPYGSATAKNQYFEQNGTTYWAGSPHLRDLLIKNKNRMVCNIHGHTHEGAFAVNIGTPHERMTVINPGSLVQSEFGEMTLRLNTHGKWEISATSKIFL